MIRLRETAEGCMLAIRVHPGAHANTITGVHDRALKISLIAPSTDGRANEALITLLADRLSLPKSHIELAGGATSRNKLLCIRGKTAAEIEATLLSSLS